MNNAYQFWSMFYRKNLLFARESFVDQRH
jgi:hypothetical protein